MESWSFCLFLLESHVRASIPSLSGLLFVVVRIIWSRHPSSLTQSSSLEYIYNTRVVFWLFYWPSTANRSYTTSPTKGVRTERHVTEVVVTIVEHHWIRPASVSCDYDLFITWEYSLSSRILNVPHPSPVPLTLVIAIYRVTHTTLFSRRQATK